MQKQEIVEKALANFSDPLKRNQYFELYAPEIVLHGYGVVERGIDSVKQYYYGVWDAIPDAWSAGASQIHFRWPFNLGSFLCRNKLALSRFAKA